MHKHSETSQKMSVWFDETDALNFSLSLFSDDVRSANIIADENGVECLVIDRE